MGSSGGGEGTLRAERGGGVRRARCATEREGAAPVRGGRVRAGSRGGRGEIWVRGGGGG
jgi:hypothetical protein